MAIANINKAFASYTILSFTLLQLLSGSLKIDYITWLKSPLSLNPERTWLHLSRRCDFQDDAKLSMPEIAMVAAITKVMKKRKETARVVNVNVNLNE